MKESYKLIQNIEIHKTFGINIFFFQLKMFLIVKSWKFEIFMKKKSNQTVSLILERRQTFNNETFKFSYLVNTKSIYAAFHH